MRVLPGALLRRALKKQKAAAASTILFSLIVCVCEIAAPYLIGRATDRMIGPGQVDFPGVLIIIGLLAGMFLLDGLLLYLLNLISTAASNHIVAQIRREAYAVLNRLPLRYYDSQPHGDIISRFVNDADTVADGLLQGAVLLVRGIITIVGTAVIMVLLSPVVTLAVVGATSLVFLVAYLVTRFSHQSFRAQQSILGELNGCAEEYIGQIKTVQAMSMENTAQKRFDGINKRLYFAGQRAQFASSLTNPTTRFVNNIAYILVGLVGGLAGGLSAGGVSSFIFYANQFAKPFNEITAVTTQVMAAWAALRRMTEVMNEEPEPDDGNLPPLGSVRGEVVFEHISFSYWSDRPLIRDFSLQVAPGSTVAIVGPTGAGKTTLINLLLRFYEPQSGRIMVDGKDISAVQRDSLRQAFGMVLQDTWLFTGTVADNIAYACPKASREEVIAAAKAARAHGFIKRLPKGYDTVLTEQGADLSAGQRQLLTIARAMLAQPSILILDEATSSVDTLTEQRIQEGFLKMMENRTSFVIAHRLSTIRNASLILVLQNGQVVEQGTHNELLERKGAYYTLYNSQFEPEEKA